MLDIKPVATLVSDLPRDLGEGLVLRYATSADAGPLADFNGPLHGDDPADAARVSVWTRDFMSDAHPTCGPSNTTIVAAAGGRIVSSICLIPQTWSYAGIPIGVGRPEAVGTDPAYRRRGLVRAQFDVLHAKSAAMGHQVQAITGIQWYYRQFGYEYALDLGGGRGVYFDAIPTLKAGQAEAYRLRPLTLDDLPFVMPLYERECARWLVVCPRPEWLWRHTLTGYSPDSWETRPFRVIETAEGRAVGYVAGSRDVFRKMYAISEIVVVEGQSLRAVMPSVMRAMKDLALAEGEASQKEVVGLYLRFGREHPVFDAIPEMASVNRPPYAWYLRVADVPGFLRHVAPALEARLARSHLAGHTGELKVNEYQGGFRMVFENGTLTAVEPWRRADGEEESASFPPLVFLQLLFGFRSLAELRYAYADCTANDEAAVLLEGLFPRQASFVIPVG
jgi:hypothetical protein